MLAPSLFNQGMSATSAPTTASLPMLLHWSTLGMALLFCFILNLLCTRVCLSMARLAGKHRKLTLTS